MLSFYAACRSFHCNFRLKVLPQLGAFKEFHPVLACAGSGPARLEIKIDLDYIKAIRGRVCEMTLMQRGLRGTGSPHWPKAFPSL